MIYEKVGSDELGKLRPLACSQCGRETTYLKYGMCVECASKHVRAMDQAMAAVNAQTRLYTCRGCGIIAQPDKFETEDMCKRCYPNQTSAEEAHKAALRRSYHVAGPKLEQYPGGATRTPKPRYSLIPKAALDSLAARFELGEARHAPNAWNAHSPIRESALTTEWVMAALDHVVSHAYLAMEKVRRGEAMGDDDAGAIMFGGAVLASYWALLDVDSGEDKVTT